MTFLWIGKGKIEYKINRFHVSNITAETLLRICNYTKLNCSNSASRPSSSVAKLTLVSVTEEVKSTGISVFSSKNAVGYSLPIKLYRIDRSPDNHV